MWYLVAFMDDYFSKFREVRLIKLKHLVPGVVEEVLKACREW